ncbi:MAG: hypothetical protein UV70_C0005G0082 [Parcubacteria group bacterium GW2011_GWA2_43_13]|nr:MAG: hypothetical protein UV70_C0005G0082 [Parcubacteria group bacterium GW2011_GWA2_43_13]HAZ17064.1 hypothetical protein [Candidatus Jacksonbacteria bacterium]
MIKGILLALVALLGAPVSGFAGDYAGFLFSTEQTPYDEQSFVSGVFLGTKQESGFSGSLAVGAFQPLQEVTRQKSDIAVIPRVGFSYGAFATSLRIFASPKNAYHGTLGGELSIPTEWPIDVVIDGGYTFGWGLNSPDGRYRLDGLSVGTGVEFGGGSVRAKILGTFEASNASVMSKGKSAVSTARHWHVGPQTIIVFRPEGSNWCIQPSIGVGVIGKNLKGEELDPEFSFGFRVFTRR